MLNENKLEVGICITEENKLYKREGVIIENDGTKIGVLWFVKHHFIKEKYDYYYSEKHYYSFSEIDDFNYAIVPHFCHMKNLYEILEKYSDDNTFYLLGVSYSQNKFSNLENSTNMSSLYLKTKKNTFLEIIVCHQLEDNKWPYVWINESNNLFDLHLNNSATFYVLTNIQKLYMTNFNNEDFYGIHLKCNDITIYVQTHIKECLKYIINDNGMTIVYHKSSSSILQKLNKEDFEEYLLLILSYRNLEHYD